MISLARLLSGKIPTIEIVDVGAMDVEGMAPPYEPLLAVAGLARVTGFEPVPEEFAKFNARAVPGRRALPYFIGDGTEGVFRTCDPAMTSSLYEPNLDLCTRFFGLAEVMRVVKRERVQTTRLDDIAELTRIDYLKMDIQGGELNALRGGERALREALVIDLEVEFVPLYVDQPLFADVDRHLRGMGFLFHGFATNNVGGRSMKPLRHPIDDSHTYGQLLWGDAVYVRDYTKLGALSPDELLKLAVVMNDAYAAPDMAAHALMERDRQTGSRTSEAFVRMFEHDYIRWHNEEQARAARAVGQPAPVPIPLPPAPAGLTL
jgi:FkbM family methyltransferase